MKSNQLEKYKVERKEVKEVITLTAQYNLQVIRKADHDRLDELIIKDEFYMRLFEIFTDKKNKKALKELAKSL